MKKIQDDLIANKVFIFSVFYLVHDPTLNSTV